MDFGWNRTAKTVTDSDCHGSTTPARGRAPAGGRSASASAESLPVSPALALTGSLRLLRRRVTLVLLVATGSGAAAAGALLLVLLLPP